MKKLLAILLVTGVLATGVVGCGTQAPPPANTGEVKPPPTRADKGIPDDITPQKRK
jgi:hypothetical protein